MNPQELVKALSNYVNRMGHDTDTIANEIMREHRTLQQNIFGLFLRVIEEWSKQEHSDLRNQYTIETSKRIMEVLENNTTTPYI
jgi:hypothetical protein